MGTEIEHVRRAMGYGGQTQAPRNASRFPRGLSRIDLSQFFATCRSRTGFLLFRCNTGRRTG